MYSQSDEYLRTSPLRLPVHIPVLSGIISRIGLEQKIVLSPSALIIYTHTPFLYPSNMVSVNLSASWLISVQSAPAVYKAFPHFVLLTQVCLTLCGQLDPMACCAYVLNVFYLRCFLPLGWVVRCLKAKNIFCSPLFFLNPAQCTGYTVASHKSLITLFSDFHILLQFRLDNLTSYLAPHYVYTSQWITSLTSNSCSKMAQFLSAFITDSCYEIGK